MGPIVFFVVALAFVIVVSVWARRRQLRNRLLKHGARARGRQVKVSVAPRQASALRKAMQTVTVVSYTDASGRQRSVVPRQIRWFDWGDGTGVVTVVYDAKRPAVPDRILFGFGDDPRRWYRVRLHGARVA